MSVIETDPKKIKQKPQTEIIGEFSLEDIGVEKPTIENIGDGVHDIPSAELEVAQPDIAEPDVSQPEVDESEAAQPEVTEQEVIQPEEREKVGIAISNVVINPANDGRSPECEHGEAATYPIVESAEKKIDFIITNDITEEDRVNEVIKIAEKCSVNGVDPFSSPKAFQDMFNNAVASGYIKAENKPDFSRNIIFDNKVYFKDEIVSLEELGIKPNELKDDIKQAIMGAESPEKVKETFSRKGREQTIGVELDNSSVGKSVHSMNQEQSGMDIGDR